jgi:hypothetical protein
MSVAVSSGLLKEPSARTLIAGDLEAVFLPRHGMLGASLRHRGVEILRRVEDLDAAAAKDAGIPISTLGGYSHAPIFAPKDQDYSARADHRAGEHPHQSRAPFRAFG